MCLSVGAVAALVTTPLDVAKTRIMLAKVYTL